MHDFRSDTITQPTPAMRQFMADAPLGDDVFGEDPTINRLEATVAEMLGKEAALYVPSGTMSNQLGVRAHCRPGDEFLCEAGCHIYRYEQAAYAQLSGVAARPMEGKRGLLDVSQFQGMINPENPHLTRTVLVCLENTHNRGSGRVHPYGQVEAICRWAHDNGLRTHLDGARLFNAAVASGIEASEWAQHFDTVSVCFSKGLGAPVGSALCGPKDLIADAYRARKMFGGGMRQAGVIAAGALFALENHIDRLADDHARAKRLAEAITQTEGLRLFAEEVETNIVIFEVDPALGTAGSFVDRCTQQGLAMLALGPQLVRMVTHLDVDDEDVEAAIRILSETAAQPASEAEAASASPYV